MSAETSGKTPSNDSEVKQVPAVSDYTSSHGKSEDQVAKSEHVKEKSKRDENDKLPTAENAASNSNTAAVDVEGKKDARKVGESEQTAGKSSVDQEVSNPAELKVTSNEAEKPFLTFPERLLSIIEDERYNRALWWNPDGTAFCVIPRGFTDYVLKNHFQGTKFESFTRKLNRWGFKRILDDFFPSESVAYKHECFQKGKPELLKQMNGGKKKEKRIQASQEAVQYQNGILNGVSPLLGNASLPSVPSSLSNELLRQQLLRRSTLSDQLLGAQAFGPFDPPAIEQLLASQQLQQQSSTALFRQQAEMAAAEQMLTVERLRGLQRGQRGVGGGISLADQLLLSQANQGSATDLRVTSQLVQLQQQLGNSNMLASRLLQQQKMGMANQLLGQRNDGVIAQELRSRLLQEQLGGQLGSQSELTRTMMASRGISTQGPQLVNQQLLELHALSEERKRLSGGGNGNI